MLQPYDEGLSFGANKKCLMKYRQKLVFFFNLYTFLIASIKINNNINFIFYQYKFYTLIVGGSSVKL